MARKVSVAKTVSDTNKHTIFTVPTKYSGLWELMYIISLSATETPKVYWYDSSSNIEYFIVGGKNLGAGDYILLSSAVVVLEEGDEIRVQNTGTNQVTYLATIEYAPAQATQFHN